MQSVWRCSDYFPIFPKMCVVTFWMTLLLCIILSESTRGSQSRLFININEMNHNKPLSKEQTVLSVFCVIIKSVYTFFPILKWVFQSNIVPEILSSLIHQWPYKFNKPQSPYHGLSDWVFFSKTFYTWASMTIPHSDWLGFLNPVCETVV